MQKYPGAFTLLGFSLSHYLLFPDFWDNLTFVRFGGYTIIIASLILQKLFDKTIKHCGIIVYHN